MSATATRVDLEEVRRLTYRLQAYDFAGGFGINQLTNVLVPAMIVELETLRQENERLAARREETHKPQ